MVAVHSHADCNFLEGQLGADSYKLVINRHSGNMIMVVNRWDLIRVFVDLEPRYVIDDSSNQRFEHLNN